MAYADGYIVKTDKLIAIANGIREKTGKTGTITVDEMPIKIAEVYEVGFEEGLEEGKGILPDTTNAEGVRF